MYLVVSLALQSQDAFNNVPHQNGKQDQVRKHFRKLCQEIPQKPIECYQSSTQAQRPDIMRTWIKSRIPSSLSAPSTTKTKWRVA